LSGDAWDTSGVAELLLRNHRVIIFDRPGFGYSERPRGHLWTAAQRFTGSCASPASTAMLNRVLDR
jgi:pimeloyl-ACP methyl ester carboxylesterase